MDPGIYIGFWKSEFFYTLVRALMSCTCATLGVIEKVEAHQSFFTALPILEIGNWVKLGQCSSCGQLWSVDEWDKGSISFARKLASRENWQIVDVKAQKEFLLRARGVQVGVKCMHGGCSEAALNGVAFCVDHLYSMGWRE